MLPALIVRDLRKTKLRCGAMLELRIAHAGMRGKVVRAVGRSPRLGDGNHALLEAGAKKPTSCCAR
jgi:hypothetical protein